MTTTHTVPDWYLNQMRREGQLVCRCLKPRFIRLQLWCADECAYCGKPILPCPPST